VVIAPDYNATTVHADLWINLKPETDAALGLAAAQVMVSEGLYDADYVREQTDLPMLVREDNGRFLRDSDLRKRGDESRLYVWDEARGRLAVAPGCAGDGNGGRSLALGKLKPALEGRFEVELAGGKTVAVRPVFERLREQLADTTPERAAEITGLTPELIRRFARELAAAPRAMIFASWGACKHHHSDLFQRAMILLMALTGNQGKAGSGVRVAAWWGLDGLAWMAGARPSFMEILRILPKAIRGLTPRDYEELFTEYSEKEPNTPLMPFLYVHGGYREMWSRPDLADPVLPRGLDEYMRQSIDRGWTKLHPSEDREPRALIFTGSNPLRRWPAPQHALRHLWPKLDLVLAVNFRMSTTARHADYVLPAAAYYEKHGIKYAQTYLPYVVVSDQAVKPLGEAKSEWEIYGLLSERVAARARERGVTEVRGFKDRRHDLTKAYDVYTSDQHYHPRDPADPIKLMDDILRASPSVGSIGAQEALRLGAVPITGTARPTPIYATSSDYDPNDTYWPHRWFVEDKVAWPTLTGRQQFYEPTGAQGPAGRAQPLPSAHQRRPHPLEHPRDLARPRADAAPAARRTGLLREPGGLPPARHQRRRLDSGLQRRGRLRSARQGRARRAARRGDHLPRLGAPSVQELEGTAGAGRGSLEGDPPGRRLRPHPLPDVLRLSGPRAARRAGRDGTDPAPAGRRFPAVAGTRVQDLRRGGAPMSEDGREARTAPDPEQATAQSLATTIYTERAGSYHRFVSAVGYPQGVRAVLRDYEPLRSDLKVLDAGCGGGIATLALRDALEASPAGDHARLRSDAGDAGAVSRFSRETRHVRRRPAAGRRPAARAAARRLAGLRPDRVGVDARAHSPERASRRPRRAARPPRRRRDVPAVHQPAQLDDEIPHPALVDRQPLRPRGARDRHAARRHAPLRQAERRASSAAKTAAMRVASSLGRRSAVSRPLISCSTSASCVQHQPSTPAADSSAVTRARKRSSRASALSTRW
jgi:anaerobic selenocysteine-containing dehydrogenase